MSVTRERGSRNPNNKTLYVWDENLLFDIEIKNRSAFYNWCVRQNGLRDRFKDAFDKEKKRRTFK